MSRREGVSELEALTVLAQFLTRQRKFVVAGLSLRARSLRGTLGTFAGGGVSRIQAEFACRVRPGQAGGWGATRCCAQAALDVVVGRRRAC